MLHDFITSAWPWIVLGLSMAILAAYVLNAKKKGKKQKTSTAWFVVSLLAYSVAIMYYLSDGSFTSNAITWACLGSMYLCLGAASLHKEKNDDSVDKEKK